MKVRKEKNDTAAVWSLKTETNATLFIQKTVKFNFEINQQHSCMFNKNLTHTHTHRVMNI